MSEATHSNNLKSFHTCLSHAQRMGNAYIAPRPALEVKNLKQVADANVVIHNNTKKAVATWQKAVNDRKIKFTQVSRDLRPLMNVVRAYSLPQETMDDIAYHISKLRGSRRGDDATDTPPPTTEEGKGKAPATNEEDGNDDENAGTGTGKEGTGGEGDSKKSGPGSGSVSQLSYDSKVEHFDGLVNNIALIPDYTTTEPGFSLPDLQATLADLRASNISVINAAGELANQRTLRMQSFYLSPDSLFVIGSALRQYLLGKATKGTPDYVTLMAASFKKPAK